jgi:EAL domain-containing protein (putative c-di-GMP-specific phosphodiesterase class I)
MWPGRGIDNPPPTGCTGAVPARAHPLNPPVDLAPLPSTSAHRALTFWRTALRVLTGPPDEGLVIAVTAVLVGLGSVLACIAGPSALLYDNAQELAAAGGGALGLWLASRHRSGPTRRLLLMLAIALAGACGGMLTWDLSAGDGSVLATAGNVIFVGGVGVGVAAILPAIFGELDRDELVGVVTDALILFLAGLAVVGATWEGATATTDSRAASVGAALLVATTGSCVFALITRRIAPARAGAWPVLVGATLLGVSWLMWIGDPAAPTTVGLSDFLFSAGILLIAYGGVTWHTRTSQSPAFEPAARAFAAGLPVVAILGSLGLLAWTDGPEFFDLVGVATAAVIVTSAARQLYLYVRAAQAREAERQAGQRLADEVRERDATLLSLQRLLPGPSLEETAQRICREARGLAGIDLAVIRAYAPDGNVVPLAVEGLGARASDLVGVPLRIERAARVLARAREGPWEWSPGDGRASPYHALMRDIGVRAMVNTPLFWGGAAIGDIGLGTSSPESAVTLARRLSTVAEFGVVVAALLGPAMVERDHAATLRRSIEATISERAFHVVFQPIVDLESREIVGYEALTRFASGQRPDLCFADAWSVGLGPELELATLEAAVGEARQLPEGRWLDLNASPRLLAFPGPLQAILREAGRPLVLEITEHEIVGDYAALLEAVGSLGRDIRLAVDDAGAGVANFGHIVELRPDFVKLDIGLVRGVNVNLGRQALVVGMRYFSRTAGCRLIAEGIETEPEAATLRSLGVEFGQGYLLGRPAPVAAWGRAPKAEQPVTLR